MKKAGTGGPGFFITGGPGVSPGQILLGRVPSGAGVPACLRGDLAGCPDLRVGG